MGCFKTHNVQLLITIIFLSGRRGRFVQAAE